jgi:hypothetical protein
MSNGRESNVNQIMSLDGGGDWSWNQRVISLVVALLSPIFFIAAVAGGLIPTI